MDRNISLHIEEWIYVLAALTYASPFTKLNPYHADTARRIWEQLNEDERSIAKYELDDESLEVLE